MSEPGLFAAPKPAPLKLSAHFVYTARQPAPKYADYRLKTRHQCEECIWCVHEAKGAGGAAIRSVSVKRVVGEETILLCAEHAQRWKDREAPGAARKGRRR